MTYRELLKLLSQLNEHQLNQEALTLDEDEVMSPIVDDFNDVDGKLYLIIGA